MVTNKQAGAAHIVMLVVVLAVIGVVGVAGYKVWQKSSGTAANSSPNSKSSADAAQDIWQAGGLAVEGKYADADIVQIDNQTWRLYYAIQPEVQGNQFEVYSATSANGKDWKAESGTRKTFATFPDVVKLSDGRYRMYFQSAGVIKSAISSDGLSFVDESGTRIDTSNDAGLTFDNVAAPSVLQTEDGTYVMIYRGTINERYAANTPNAVTQLFMWATSSDGLNFTKKGIATDSRNSVLNGQLDGADLVKYDDGQYRLFATSYTGVYAFSFDGQVFGQAELAFAGEAQGQGGSFAGAPPGDPSVAQILGTWFMYYGATGAESGIHYATRQ